MCELLVRVKDKVSPDPYRDVKLTKRGDVIVVMPDGWAWSSEERTNPDWRIFKWPSESIANASALLSPELPIGQWPENAPDPMLQRRGFCLDVNFATLPQALKNYLADDSRAQAFFNVPAQVTIAALKMKRAKRPDPNVIG